MNTNRLGEPSTIREQVGDTNVRKGLQRGEATSMAAVWWILALTFAGVLAGLRPPAACGQSAELVQPVVPDASKLPLTTTPPQPPFRSSDALQFFRSQPRNPSVRHVHMMHLDGFHADLFRTMLEAGMLPHFDFLLARGKVSYSAATVDKSETFKVIQSYLTSRLDTEITAWWFFDRQTFRFHNYWLDPMDVIGYALGLEFPRYPTIFDVVTGRGETVAAGFNLYRRSVPFANYSRAYVEGARAAFQHTYYNQADATMSQLLGIYERIARNQTEPLPVFVLSLLAPADEYGHLEGIVQPRAHGEIAPDETCFKRQPEDQRADDPHEALFQMLDEDARANGWIRQLYEPESGAPRSANHQPRGYFTRVVRSKHGIQEICIHVPEVMSAAWPVEESSASAGPPRPERPNPHVVLAMIQIDIEIGRLIETLRSILPLPNGGHEFRPPARKGILGYIQSGRAEQSLFENTLFVFTGDHGMVNSPAKMVRVDPDRPDPGRHPNSLNQGFLEYLNGKVGLTTPVHQRPAPIDGNLGIDNAHTPLAIAFPHLDPSWQSPDIQRRVSEAEQWSTAFLQELQEAVRSELYQKYWWLLFLRRLLIDPKLKEALTAHQDVAHAIVTELYLRGDADYTSAEHQAIRNFYDRRVRLVYGGGALNNVELFLPSRRTEQPHWDARPGVAEIIAGDGAGVLTALKENPGVALIFVREQNGDITPDRPLPDQMIVRVMDRGGNSGRIHVRRDRTTGVLLFAYEVDTSSPADPLGYGRHGEKGLIWRTYNEWNDRSVERQDPYHNVVAGMGAYLYSTNPSIGDISAMHAQGWNFGDNGGGHGGVHREEMLTVMMVSGPSIPPGNLMGRSRFRSSDGSAIPSTTLTHPTVLDSAPTVLNWLGYGDNALADFARTGFGPHLSRWVAGQRADILANLDNIDDLNQALRSAGFDDFRVSQFRARLARLLQSLPDTPPPLPSYADFHADGNLLDLQ